jgi:hypothetical protein
VDYPCPLNLLQRGWVIGAMGRTQAHKRQQGKLLYLNKSSISRCKYISKTTTYFY